MLCIVAPFLMMRVAVYGPHGLPCLVTDNPVCAVNWKRENQLLLALFVCLYLPLLVHYAALTQARACMVSISMLWVLPKRLPC
jgi:hypothetical protein